MNVVTALVTESYRFVSNTGNQSGNRIRRERALPVGGGEMVT